MLHKSRAPFCKKYTRCFWAPRFARHLPSGKGAGAFLFWGQALTKRRWVYYNHMHAKQGGTTPLDGYGNMFLCGTLGKPWA